jgi:hypothetical protein
MNFKISSQPIFFVLLMALICGCQSQGNPADTLLGSTIPTITTSPVPATSSTPTPTPTVSILTISPTSVSLAANASQTFVAQNGVAPYAFLLLTGIGAIGATTGVYTAPGYSGSAIVEVQDSAGAIATAAIAVATSTALVISPTTQSVMVNGVIHFTASGGATPYAFSKVSGIGSIDPSSGIYTAPGGTGTAVVQVEDSLGNSVSTSVTVVGTLAISPSAPSLGVNGTQTFTASGGVTPYTYSVHVGGGSLAGAVYTAPSSTGSATVRVTDAIGDTSDATVTITVGPASQIVLTGSSPIVSGTCVGVAVTGEDGGGNVSAVGGLVTVTLSATGSGAFFSDSACSTPIASTGIAATTSTKTVYFSDTSAETSQLVATTTSLGSALLSVVVNAAPVKKLIHSGQAYLQKNVCSNAFTISAEDGSDNPLPAPAQTTITLTGTATTTFYSDGGCGSQVTTRLLAQNATSITYFMRDSLAETVPLNYTAPGWITGSGTVAVWGPLTISPTSTNLIVGNSKTFSGIGGAPPYIYSVGAGTVAGTVAAGVYTAPAGVGTSSVVVSDQVGNTATATINVVTNLVVSPAVKTVLTNQSFNLSRTGGVAPFTYSAISGIVTTTNATTGAGTYTAPASPETDTITITDSSSPPNTATVLVTILTQPIVELTFNENANNWGYNTGSSDSTLSRWGANGRAYPIFSTNVPGGNSSTASIDFGNGTGWGASSDGAVDLLELGGFRADIYANGSFSPPVAMSQLDSPVSEAYNGVYPGTGISGHQQFTIRQFGRILPATSSSYALTYNVYTSNCWGGFTETSTIYLNSPSSAASDAVGVCSNSATATTSSSAFTAGIMADFMGEMESVADNQGGFLFSYALDWLGGIYASNTPIGASFTYAPMPITSLASLTKFTITGWLNSRSAAVGDTVILDWLYSGAGGVELRYKSDGSLQMGINEPSTTAGTASSSSGKITTPDATAAVSNWVFFAVTYDSTLGSGQVSYYFGANGSPAVLDSSPTYSKGAIQGTVAELTLGNFGTSFLTARELGGVVFRGLMDEIRIYNSVLTPSQIQAVQTF